MKDEHMKIATGEIPYAWQTVKVNEIATIVRGASPRPKGDPKYYGGTVPRLMGEDVTRDGKFVTPQVDFLTEEGAKKSRFMQAGTLVMVCSGNVGVPAILAVDACVHDGFLAFPEVSDKCHLDYIYYTFDSLHEKLNSSATHGGIFTNLTTSIIKDFEITLPPLSEQQKIAKILSTVDEKIEVIGEQINQTQELKRGLMQRLLTKGIGHSRFKDSPLGRITESWEVVKLDSLVTKIGSGITPKGGREAYVEKGVIFIRSQNVLHGQLSLSDVAFITEEQHESMKNSNIEPMDVLLNITGASIGRSCVVPKEIKKANVNQHVCIIRPTDNLDSSFLCQFLNSVHGKNQVDRFQAGGNREGLNFQQIRSFLIPLPPLTEQQKITDILSTVDERLEVLQEKKQQYQELKKGLMQQLLTGKKRVKIQEPEIA